MKSPKNNTFLLVCLLITFSILAGGCRKKEEAGCTDFLPVSVQVDCENYSSGQEDSRIDAMRLAANHYAQQGIVSTDAFIPDSVWKPYFTALVAVRAAIPQITCDDLSVLEGIRPDRQASEQISITVDTSYAWTKTWRDGTSPTGDPAIDSLMDTYQLSLYQYSEYEGEGQAIFNSAEPLNMTQLGVEFATIDAVLSTGPGPIIVDGPTLGASYEGEDLVLVLGRGFIDCPPGCIHSGTFRVTPDCLVIYEK